MLDGISNCTGLTGEKRETKDTRKRKENGTGTRHGERRSFDPWK